MVDILLPLIFLLIFAFATFKRIPAYNLFLEGAKDAVSSGIGAFPYLVAVLMMVELFKASGLSGYLAEMLTPVFTFFGIPPELNELVLLRPFSGAGSLALLDNIYATYGADSFIARAASVFMGSSDTVFYVATVYFATSKIKSLKYGLPVALLATFFGTIIACLLCRVM